MAGDLILVTGANGRVGSRVVQALLDRHLRPRVLVRDVTAAKRRFGDRVDVCIADLLDADGVGRAMEGVKSVFLCSPVHPQQIRHQGHVVQAAKRNDSYVVKLSGLATFSGSGPPPFGTQNRLGKSICIRTCFFRCFPSTFRVKMTPKVIFGGVLVGIASRCSFFSAQKRFGSEK